MQKSKKRVVKKENSVKKSNRTLAVTIIGVLILLISVSSGVVATCGNGNIEGEEVCDGSNLNNKKCPDFGYTYGELSCCSDCKNFNLFGCYNVTTGACFDWDNGNNYYIVSNASQFITFIYGPPCPLIVLTGEEGGKPGDWIIEDICEGNILHEAVCDETTGMPQSLDYDCSSEGKECVNGKCITVELRANKSLIRKIIDRILDIF